MLGQQQSSTPKKEKKINFVNYRIVSERHWRKHHKQLYGGWKAHGMTGDLEMSFTENVLPTNER